MDGPEKNSTVNVSSGSFEKVSLLTETNSTELLRKYKIPEYQQKTLAMKPSTTNLPSNISQMFEPVVASESSLSSVNKVSFANESPSTNLKTDSFQSSSVLTVLGHLQQDSSKCDTMKIPSLDDANSNSFPVRQHINTKSCIQNEMGSIVNKFVNQNVGKTQNTLHCKLNTSAHLSVSHRSASDTPVNKSTSHTPSNPGSVKKLPDILMHNDKINLLRQMSQIFNEERSSICDDVSSGSEDESGDKQANVSTKTSGGFLTEFVDKNMKAQDSKIKENQFSEEVTNSSSLKVNSFLKNDSTPMSLVISADEAVFDISKKNVSHENVKCADSDYCSSNITLSETTASDLADKNKFKLSNSDDSSSTMICKSEISSSEEHENIDEKVYHVSSYRQRPEKTTVESFLGPDGEHIDRIDGFSFTSFETESDLLKYADAHKKHHGKRILKLKLKMHKLLPKSSNINKMEPRTVIEKESLTSTILPPCEAPTSVNLSISEGLASTAFTSNDLDNFLKQDTRLNISYDIPACTLTEAGVSKITNCTKTSSSKELSDILNQTSTIKFSDDKKASSTNAFDPSVSSLVTLKSVKVDSKAQGVVSDIDTKGLPKYNSVYKTEKTAIGSGSNVFVCRAGKLVPLTSVIQKPVDHSSAAEVLYVYDNGRVVLLGGSLCNFNPDVKANITARLLLPSKFGKENSSCNSARGAFKVVHIDEKLAKYALTALKHEIPRFKSGKCIQTKPFVKKKNRTVAASMATKANILDILSAKLSISDPGEKITSENKETFECKASTANCKLVNKNLHRFPFLQREMRRLNVNFVNMEVKDDEPSESCVESNNASVCCRDYCALGCICDSLQCKSREREHCGQVACMFRCECQHWSTTGTPTKKGVVYSILNINRQYQQRLALKEKDFSLTVVNTGQKLIMCGGDKKRERRVPDRYRDAVFGRLFAEEFELMSQETSSEFISPSVAEEVSGQPDVDANFEALSSYSQLDVRIVPPPDLDDSELYNCLSPPHPKEMEQAGIIPPSLSRKYVKPCRVVVPWFKLPQPLAVWCLVHDCYNCTCKKDHSNSDCEEQIADLPMTCSGKEHGQVDISGVSPQINEPKSVNYRNNSTKYLLCHQAVKDEIALQETSPNLSIPKESVSKEFPGCKGVEIGSCAIETSSGKENVLPASGTAPNITELASYLPPAPLSKKLAAHRLAASKVEVLKSPKKSLSSSPTKSNEVKIRRDHFESKVLCCAEDNSIKYIVHVNGPAAMNEIGKQIEADIQANGMKDCTANLFRSSPIRVRPECVIIEVRLRDTSRQPASRHPNFLNLLKYWTHDIGCSARTAGYSPRGFCYRHVNRADSDVNYQPPHWPCISNVTVKNVLSIFLKTGFVKDIMHKNGSIKYELENENVVYCSNRNIPCPNAPSNTLGLKPQDDKNSSKATCSTAGSSLGRDCERCSVSSSEGVVKFPEEVKFVPPAILPSDAPCKGSVNTDALMGVSAPQSTLRKPAFKVRPSLISSNSENVDISPNNHSVIFPLKANKEVKLINESLSKITPLPDTAKLLIESTPCITNDSSPAGNIPANMSTAKVITKNVALEGAVKNVSVKDGAKGTFLKDRVGNLPMKDGVSSLSMKDGIERLPTKDGVESVPVKDVARNVPMKGDPKNVLVKGGAVNVAERRWSLPKMMAEEERRGELELDLSDRTPGNSLLVSEARFRKLINMNIIGITGLNKQKRCIVAACETTFMLAHMQRVQEMICSRELDVGPNMREVFFPPHVSSLPQRPRFVLLKCNIHGDYEIIGVVQRKNSELSKQSDTQVATDCTNLSVTVKPDQEFLGLSKAHTSTDTTPSAVPLTTVASVATSCSATNATSFVQSTVSGTSASFSFIPTPVCAVMSKYKSPIAVASSGMHSASERHTSDTTAKVQCPLTVPQYVPTCSEPATSTASFPGKATIRMSSPSHVRTVGQPPVQGLNVLQNRPRFVFLPSANNSGLSGRIVMVPSCTSNGSPQYQKMILVPSSSDPKKLMLVSADSQTAVVQSISRVSVAKTELPVSSTPTTESVVIASAPNGVFAVAQKPVSHSSVPLVVDSDQKITIKVCDDKKTPVIVGTGKKILNSNATLVGSSISVPSIEMCFKPTSVKSINGTLISHCNPSSSSTSSEPFLAKKAESLVNSLTFSTPSVTASVKESDSISSTAVTQSHSSDNNPLKVLHSSVANKNRKWSAIDISLNFKSIKLGWISGIIQRSTLVEIRSMSVMNSGPVTLSVRNSSPMTSVLYGLAKSKEVNDKETILILGSSLDVVEEVIRLPTENLFRVDSPRYLFVEDGKLVPYHYCVYSKPNYLLKVASNKRPLAKGTVVPCMVHADNFRYKLASVAEGIKLEFSSKFDSEQCDCAKKGDFICLGHASKDSKLPSAVQPQKNESASSRLVSDGAEQGTPVHNENISLVVSPASTADGVMRCKISSVQNNSRRKFWLKSGKNTSASFPKFLYNAHSGTKFKRFPALQSSVQDSDSDGCSDSFEEDSEEEVDVESSDGPPVGIPHSTVEAEPNKISRTGLKRNLPTYEKPCPASKKKFPLMRKKIEILNRSDSDEEANLETKPKPLEETRPELLGQDSLDEDDESGLYPADAEFLSPVPRLTRKRIFGKARCSRGRSRASRLRLIVQDKDGASERIQRNDNELSSVFGDESSVQCEERVYDCVSDSMREADEFQSPVVKSSKKRRRRRSGGKQVADSSVESSCLQNNSSDGDSNSGGSTKWRGKDNNHNEMERLRRKQIGQLFVHLQRVLQEAEGKNIPDSRRILWPKRMALNKAIEFLDNKHKLADQLASRDKQLRRAFNQRMMKLQSLLDDETLPEFCRQRVSTVLSYIRPPTRVKDLEMKFFWLVPQDKSRPDSADEEFVLDVDGSTTLNETGSKSERSLQDTPEVAAIAAEVAPSTSGLSQSNKFKPIKPFAKQRSTKLFKRGPMFGKFSQFSRTLSHSKRTKPNQNTESSEASPHVSLPKDSKSCGLLKKRPLSTRMHSTPRTEFSHLRANSKLLLLSSANDSGHADAATTTEPVVAQSLSFSTLPTESLPNSLSSNSTLFGCHATSLKTNPDESF